MDLYTWTAVLVPFAGTVLGSAFVFFLKKDLPAKTEKALIGFAAGIMTAAAIWSLLLPALEESSHLGKWAFLPSFIGFWIGILFLLALDELVPHLHRDSDQAEGPALPLSRQTKMLLAVTLHNVPEGFAVGAVFAGILSGQSNVTFSGALALALGIAIQNVPEGAVIALPLHATGQSRMKAFLSGCLSGIVEPLGTLLTLMLSVVIAPVMPYFLSFAAGAMLYVVVEELVPEMSAGEHSNTAVLFYALGFSLMMVLDTVLG